MTSSIKGGEGPRVPESVIPKITVRPGVNLKKEIETLGLKDKIISQLGKLTQVEAHLVEITDGRERVWVKKEDLAEGISRYLIATKNLGDDPGALRAQARDPKQPTKDVDQAAVAKYRVLEGMLEGEVLGKLARNRIISRVAEQYAIAKANEQQKTVAGDESELKGVASRISGGKGIDKSVAGLRAKRAEAVSLPTLKQLKQEKMEELEESVSTYDFLVGLQKTGKITNNQKQQLKALAEKLVEAGVLQKQGRVFKEYSLADTQRIAKKDLTPEEQRTYEKLMDEAIKDYSKISTDSGKYKRLSEELTDRPVSGLKGLVTKLIDKQFRDTGRNELKPQTSLADFFSKMTGASEAPESTKGTIAQLPERVPEVFDQVLKREADQLTSAELATNNKFKKLDQECNNFLKVNRFSKQDIAKIKERVDKAVKDYKPGDKLPMVPFPQTAHYKGGGKGVEFMRKAVEHEIIRRDTFLKHYEFLKGNVPKGVDTSADRGVQTGSARHLATAGSGGVKREVPRGASMLTGVELDSKEAASGAVVAPPRRELGAAGVEIRRDERGGAEKEDKEKDAQPVPPKPFDFSVGDSELSFKEAEAGWREATKSTFSSKKVVKTKLSETAVKKSTKPEPSSAIKFQSVHSESAMKAFLLEAEKAINSPYLTIAERRDALKKLVDDAELAGVFYVENDAERIKVLHHKELIRSGDIKYLMKTYIPEYDSLQFARQFVKAQTSGDKLWSNNKGDIVTAKENPKKGEWQEVSKKDVQAKLDKGFKDIATGKLSVPDPEFVADFARLAVRERPLPKITEEAAKTWKTDPKARDVFITTIDNKPFVGLLRKDRAKGLPPATLPEIQKYVADREGAEAFVKGEPEDAIQLYLALREKVLTVNPKERFDFVAALKTLHELETVLNKGTVRTERFRK
jgi:hypothetical protein